MALMNPETGERVSGPTAFFNRTYDEQSILSWNSLNSEMAATDSVLSQILAQLQEMQKNQQVLSAKVGVWLDVHERGV